MELAICADIHGNYDRLVKFDRMTSHIPPRYKYILGDMIHWGTEFAENRCVDFIRKRGYTTLSGNHEWIPLARRSLLTQMGKTDSLDTKFYPQNIEYLSQLPREIREQDLLFAHSLPLEEPIRIKETQDAAKIFPLLSKAGIKIAFVGHSHTPIAFEYNPSVKKVTKSKSRNIVLQSSCHYIINPGTLGLYTPGSFIIFNPITKTVERMEVE